MSKLWIIHRHSRRRDALAFLSGLASPDLVCGAPDDAHFADASPPAAFLMGIENDFELELDFLHRHRAALAGARRYFLTSPEDVADVRRLFDASDHEILDGVPSDRALRALVVSATSHRIAESLAERRDRDRIAKRFGRWFGELEIPGLLRALDPSLRALPLLVRGAPGSGRSLMARYAELFRGGDTRAGAGRSGSGPRLRIDGRELTDIDALLGRLRARRSAGLPDAHTVWIDEVDACSPGVQRALAEWIRLGAAPSGAVGAPLRWIATAGPPGLRDSLETDLERAFAPLVLTIPPIIEHPEALAGFADRVSAEWTETVGGAPRQIGENTYAALEAHAWTGDRAAVEAILRASLASTGQDPLESLEPSAGHPPADHSAHPPITRPAHPPVTRDEDAASAPIEEATFLDDLAAADHDSSAPSDTHLPDAHPMADFPEEALGGAFSDATRHPETPESIEDFERAFLEGLPAPGPATETDAELEGQSAGPAAPETRDEVPPAQTSLDPSTEWSDESFEVARTGVVPPSPAAISGSDSWRRLARSLSHEIRNPLVSIRTFTELLPEHFEDASFRERFTELVGRDVAHIDEVVSRLADAAAPEKLEAAPVDVSALIERLLDARRERIGEGRLLVLRELEREAPIAWADPHALEVALAGLLDRALAALPERGDLFVATRRIDRAADGTPRLRVLLRHHNPSRSNLDSSLGPDAELATDLGSGLASTNGTGLEELGSAANVLEYVLAETVIEASGGSLTIDTTDAQETLILVDLRTPA